MRDAQRRRSRARPPRRAGPILGRARARAPVRGLGGRHPRRDPVHDPRRGHGLGPGRRGQLGRDGPDGRRLPQAGHGRGCRSGPRAGSPTLGGGSSTPPVTSSMRRPASSSRPRPASTSPPAQTRSASSAIDTRTAHRGPGDRRRHGRRARPARPGGRRTLVIDTPARSEATAHAVAFVAAHRDAAEALGTDLAEFTQRPGRLRRGADDRGSRPWPIRSTSTASSGSRPASARSTASAGRCWRPSSAASATRPAASGRRRSCSSPTGSSTRRSSRRAGSRSASSSGRSTSRPSGPGSSSAAPPARPATGSRSTRSRTRTARASPPSRIAGPSWSCSSTARRAGSAASSARRSRR